MEYRWYAVQTTAGHENKVRMLLQKRIEEDPRPAEQKLVRQALVPVQEAIEIKNGKKVVVERKLYPGYVLIETTMSQEAQHLVNSVQGVIKFVGTGKLPQPLRQDEVNRLLGISEETADSGPKEEIPYLVGPGGGDHRGPVRRLQRHGGRGVVGQGKGQSLGLPVRAADDGGAGLFAIAGALVGCWVRVLAAGNSRYQNPEPSNQPPARHRTGIRGRNKGRG